MDDTISRLAVIEAIEKARANVGHNLDRSIGKSIIEILDDVGRDVDRLPSALGTNLAEVGTDLISRAQAIDAVNRLSLGETDATRLAMRIWDYLERLPSAQPTFDARDTQYNLPIGTDLISRRAAINMCRKPRMRNADCSDFEMEIMMLPSAGPKRGKWINDRCSVCGYGVMPWNNTPYCHRCGADMRGEQDG